MITSLTGNIAPVYLLIDATEKAKPLFELCSQSASFKSLYARLLIFTFSMLIREPHGSAELV